MITDQQIMEPMRDFLLTYPYGTPFQRIDIFYGAVRLDIPGTETNILNLISRNVISNMPFLNTSGYRIERINFALKMYRDISNNKDIADVMEYINRNIRWINEQQQKLNPMIPQFGIDNFLSANGGGQTAIIDDTRTEYQIAYHYDFKTKYEPSNDFYKNLI